LRFNAPGKSVSSSLNHEGANYQSPIEVAKLERMTDENSTTLEAIQKFKFTVSVPDRIAHHHTSPMVLHTRLNYDKFDFAGKQSLSKITTQLKRI